MVLQLDHPLPPCHDRKEKMFTSSRQSHYICFHPSIAPRFSASTAPHASQVQRDVNIALMNELARVYSADGIEMAEVISAASTKWNFARYSPGLVGGECIAVDPHYLIDRAKQLKVPSPLVVTARATNDAFAHEVGRCCHAVAMERLCNGSGKPVAGGCRPVSRVNVLLSPPYPRSRSFCSLQCVHVPVRERGVGGGGEEIVR